MKDRDHLKKVYKRFQDFVAIAATRELDYFIMDSRYTSSFNYRMKQLIEDIRIEKGADLGFTIFFNTDGEIAVVDADIIGKFIGNNYTVHMEEYYKDNKLNKIIREVVNGTDKTKSDFLVISYRVMYHVLREIYREITCKKDSITEFKKQYDLMDYDGNDISIVKASFLILEDMCRYLGIEDRFLRECVDVAVKRKYSQES